MDKKKLELILQKHCEWLCGKENSCRADLSDADLSGVDLRRANLRDADLRDADLSGANLRGTNLHRADLSGANLRDADLSGANLSGTNLSGVDGIFWLKRLLVEKRKVLRYLGYEIHKNYFIGYKSFNENYNKPKKWGEIKSCIKIKEYVDMDIYNTCSRGINVGTKKWCEKNCSKEVWKVKIPFTADICIPIYTDGKIRVSECTILKQD